jgi:hypothetical protein
LFETAAPHDIRKMRPDAFKTCLEDKLLENPQVNNEAIDRCVEKLTGDIH